jgi:hypothetical protein
LRKASVVERQALGGLRQQRRLYVRGGGGLLRQGQHLLRSIDSHDLFDSLPVEGPVAARAEADLERPPLRLANRAFSIGAQLSLYHRQMG